MRTPLVATSFNLLKGAMQKVLDTPLTHGVTYNSKTKGRPIFLSHPRSVNFLILAGRVAVHYAATAAPGDDVIAKIELEVSPHPTIRSQSSGQ